MLLLLTVHEVTRYMRACRDEEDIPYPRRRLSRRMGIAVLFSSVLILAIYWPKTSPKSQLVLIGSLLFSALFGLVLVWRDLRETSRAVVAHASRMSEEASHDLAEAIKRHKGGQGRPKHGKKRRR